MGERGMRILAIHAKHFSYEVIEPAIDEPERVTGELKKTFENVLVLFTSVEVVDDLDIVDDVVLEAGRLVEQIKPSEVLIYPYAHLSQNLAPPGKAVEILNKLLAEASRQLKVPVYKAPFGWYKAFRLECYGHPLSELSRTITKKGATQQKVVIEKKYYVMTPEGSIFRPEEFDYSRYPELRILVDKEVYGKELEGGENRVNSYCKKFGFEWETMSDHGHMRYSPPAAVIMEAVSKYSWQVAKSLGIPVFRVMGTNMFSLRERPVYEHALLFGDRLYEVEVDNERYVLRYAACHQQFAMLKDWIISYKDLPFGVFEVADSYRLEQRGEVSLCFRLRKFYMPDLHILTRDLKEAVEVAKKVQVRIHEEAKALGRRYIALYNVTEDFLMNHKEDLLEFVKNENMPVLLAVIPPGIYYWVINVEYHIIDNIGRPREIATFQIDVGNSKRFGITYVDEKGEKKHPIIIHTAIIGSIERYIYMVLDTAAIMEKEGRTPHLPTWLAPVQVRVIPVSREFLDYAVEVAEEVSRQGFRVDLDDRDLSLGKKVREAAMSWVPYIVVIGRREVETHTINVKIRRTNEQRSMGVKELIKLLIDEVKAYPQVDAAMPTRLSMRPVF
ncbi:MAG: threonine--tRNA ligase [Desulfurococcaceae archaeon]